MKTKPDCLIAAFGLALLNLFSPVVHGEDYTYTTNNGTITIEEYIGPGGDVTIPGEINGLPVTVVGMFAFALCNVTRIAIPNTVTNLTQHPFSYCLELTAITVDATNPVYSSVDGVLFNENQTALLRYPPSKAASQYTIPDTVTRIESSMGFSGNGGTFAFCTNLTTVTIGNSVASIGDAAFISCTSLSNILIPKSVITIGNWVFDGCISLTEVSVDARNSVYSSADGVLFDKHQTTLIGFPGGKAGSYNVPKSATGIGKAAFADCASLTSVAIPEGVTSIGQAAFLRCTGLTNVTIGKSVASIGQHAFGGCASLISVTIPDAVISIGGSAFNGCTSLTNVMIGKSLVSVGDWAFAQCISLAGVYFQGNAPGLEGTNVFYGDNSTLYYLPGTKGWSVAFGSRPTALWVLPCPVILTTAPTFGILITAFGFRVSWATNASVVVEASTTLANPVWFPVSTNPLINGWSDFSDAEWTNYPSRFYRVRSL